MTAKRHYHQLGEDEPLTITSALSQAANALDQASQTYIRQDDPAGMVDVSRGWLAISQYISDLAESGLLDSSQPSTQKAKEQEPKIQVGFQLPKKDD